MDKQWKKAVVIDIAILSDSDIRKKEQEKLEKYPWLVEELEKMWGVKVTVVMGVQTGRVATVGYRSNI